MSISVLVGILIYWKYASLGISPDLDETSFWMFLETFLGYFWTVSKLFWISCMSVSLLVSFLPYWYYVNIEITPLLDEIFFWNFMEKFPGNFWTIFKSFWISCMYVSLLVGLFSYWNQANIGKSLVRDKICFWNFLEAFPKWLYSRSK